MSDQPFWKTVVAGGSAGVMEILCMYPTDVMKTRIQLSANPMGLMEAFKDILKTQGASGLYRGVTSPILAEGPKRAWKFGANDQFKGLIASASPGGKLSVPGSALAGSLAGVSEAIINTPFETLKVRLQSKENLSKYKGSSDAFFKIMQEEGILALYNGFAPQAIRNGVWNGCYFGVIGLASIKFPLPQESSKAEKLGYKFVTGVVGSTVGTLGNTPFDVVKSRMQAQTVGVDGSKKYRGVFQSLSTIASEEGVGALYKGLGARLLRLGPGGGIMIVMFDFVNNLLKDF